MALYKPSTKFMNILLIFVGSLLIMVGLYRLISLLPYVSDPNADYYTYYHSAELIIAGKSIYSWHNMQSPTTCLIFVPFALLPLRVSALLWTVFTIICYFWMGIIILRAYKISLSVPWGILLFGLALSWYPFLIHISVGQLNIPISLLIILAWAWLRKKQDLGAGFLLGIACFIKLFPGIFLVYLLLRRKWKALICMIITILGGFILTGLITGFKEIFYFFSKVVTQDSSIWIAYPFNLSLGSTIQILFLGSSQVIPIIHSKLIATILLFLIDFGLLVLLICQIIKLPVNPLGDDLAYNTVIIVMLLLSPITWQHIYPILLIILVLLFVLFLQAKTVLYLRLLVLSFLFLSFPSHEILPFLNQLVGSDILPWYVVIILQIPIIGVLLLWISICVVEKYKFGFHQVQKNNLANNNA